MSENQSPNPEEEHPLVELLASVLAALVIAGFLFGVFHLVLFLFSLVYKLSVHFHYLP